MAPPPPLSSSLSFSVRRSKPELIIPLGLTPRELKQLSDIDDQQSLRFQLPVIMFYKNNKSTNSPPPHDQEDPVRVIREAIAKALVFYYPLAGRLIEEPNGELTMDCTSEGVLFIEANAEVSLKQLGDAIQPPCPYAKEFLYDVPGSGGITNCPLLLIQITRLSCGGFVLAIRLNHAVSDAFGLVQFLKATAEIVRGGCGSCATPSLLPVWQRELLNARYPPHSTFPHHEYDNDEDRTRMIIVNKDNNHMVHQSFFFGTTQLRAILNHLSPSVLLQSSGCNCSTLDVLIAFLWRCRTIALGVDPNDIVRVTTTVDVRGVLNMLLPPGYYGNSFVFSTAISKARDLCEKPLGYALELVMKTKAKVTEEYIRSVSDFMVIKGRPPYSSSWNFVVCDMTNTGFGEVDFGWGKPVYAGPVGALSFSSPIARLKNSEGEDGIVVPMCLPVEVMERFRNEIWRMTIKEAIEDSNVMDPIKMVSKL